MNTNSTNKFRIFFIITVTLIGIGFVFCIIGGSLLFTDIHYYTYTYYSSYEHDYVTVTNWHAFDFEGCVSLVGAFVLLFALLFTVLAYLRKTAKAHLFLIGTVISSALSCALLATGGVDAVANGSDYGAMVIIAAIAAFLLFPVSIAYVVLKSKNKDESVDTPKKNQQESPRRVLSFAQGATELDCLKDLLDCQAITKSEFDIQKSKILLAMGISLKNTPQLNGNFDCGNGITLILNNNRFAFKQLTNSNSLTGTYEIDDSNAVILKKSDGSTLELKITEDGNLISPNGTKYTRK